MPGVGRRRAMIEHGSGSAGHHRGLKRAVLRACALVLAPALICLIGCGQNTKISGDQRLVVASTTLPASAAVYVAAEKGMFEDEGVDVAVETYGAGRLAFYAMLRGEADIALVAETPLAKAVYDGRDPVIFATISQGDNMNFVVARKDRGIGSAGDLIGKKVGLLKGTSADFFLNLYLVTSGVEPESVDMVPLGTEALVPALVAGEVDAISAFAPYTIDAQELLGPNGIVLDEPGLQVTYWNSVVTRITASERREALKAFLRAIDTANRYIVAHPREAQQITAVQTRIPIDQVRQQWQGLEWRVSLDQSLILSLEDEYRWMSGEDKSPDFLRYFDLAPLLSIDPMRVTIVGEGP